MENINLAQIVKNRLGLPGLADAYKPTHAYQYPDNTEEVCVYFEARKNKFGHDYVIPFGDMMFIKQYLNGPITMDQVKYSAEFWAKVGVPFPKEDFEIIVNEYQGYLPLQIKALPEGTVANVHTALYTMKTLDKRFFWLPAFIETIKQQNSWYPTTVCTLSWTAKKLQTEFHLESSDLPLEVLDYKLHDFGFRATTCLEQAIIGSTSNAVNYKGSDTSVGNEGANLAYNCEAETGDVATHSIPAMEHMTSTIWGRAGETAAIENFIRKFCLDGGMGSVIGDTYNIYEFCRKILGEDLYKLITIEVAEAGGCVIVRPDSGCPTTVPIKVIDILMSIFGYTVNSKKYKVLPPFIRVIQGDGMDLDSINRLQNNMREWGFSLDNLATGMGGGLLQKVCRDDLSMAQKGCRGTVNGEVRNISKDPITDPGKKSQEGELAVIRCETTGKLINVQLEDLGNRKDFLEVIYNIGPVERDVKWTDIRGRAHAGLLLVIKKEAEAKKNQKAIEESKFARVHPDRARKSWSDKVVNDG